MNRANQRKFIQALILDFKLEIFLATCFQKWSSSRSNIVRKKHEDTVEKYFMRLKNNLENKRHNVRDKSDFKTDRWVSAKLS